MQEEQEKAEALSAVGDLLLQMMLEADLPEESKTGFLILKATRDINTQLRKMAEAYATPESEATLETKKRVLERLLLVEGSIKQFEKTING